MPPASAALAVGFKPKAVTIMEGAPWEGRAGINPLGHKSRKCSITGSKYAHLIAECCVDYGWPGLGLAAWQSWPSWPRRLTFKIIAHIKTARSLARLSASKFNFITVM